MFAIREFIENKKSKNNELKIYREQFDKAIELVRNKF
jgi:transitional endoplasmic reticulum ATPase